ncbi:uncharacterized protein LY89DRAFT_706372 [Mollisia scopiformis]|uniref:Uncharacterized protein n=1 Tax=Mollisia scopiformis TaxID=149040 RepID=A0A194XEU0_MOLSC|nr:uncharacterized protein LY89DRAFT_706372 [Mollisia scopiformis]KUJ18683.1 hypothetical protein LY89DRAFT_706372 [Mollisia scopiformis]
MMAVLFRFSLVLAVFAGCLNAQQIVNGQIYTPGIALVDSPQPNTPEGGDFLQVALDVTSDGQLALPPYPTNPNSAIWNITIFLSSYTTGYNFTISNGTATANNASLGEIMAQEPSSTVKHVNWVWPDCLVGDGASSDNSSARGAYNISIRQNFRLNGTNMYTIFDLPIKVTNSIPAESNRPACDSLNNPLLDQATLNASANNFTRIVGTAIQGNSGSGSSSNGLGGAGMLDWKTSVHAIWILAFVFMVLL